MTPRKFGRLQGSNWHTRTKLKPPVRGGGVPDALQVALDLIVVDSRGATEVLADIGVAADRAALGNARREIVVAMEVAPDSLVLPAVGVSATLDAVLDFNVAPD